jgi:hypothetical protein
MKDYFKNLVMLRKSKDLKNLVKLILLMKKSQNKVICIQKLRKIIIKWKTSLPNKKLKQNNLMKIFTTFNKNI